MGKVIPFDGEDDTPEVKDRIRKTLYHSIVMLREQERNIRIAAEEEIGEHRREILEYADSIAVQIEKTERLIQRLKQIGRV